MARLSLFFMRAAGTFDSWLCDSATAVQIRIASVRYTDFFETNRLIVTQSPALVVEGSVQNQDGVVHVKAERVAPLRDPDLPEQTSHDFP